MGMHARMMFLYTWCNIKSTETKMNTSSHPLSKLVMTDEWVSYIYFRLTPSYAFAILFTAGLYGKFGNGPLWEDSFTSRQHQCENYWWTNLLYINNMYPIFSYEQVRLVKVTPVLSRSNSVRFLQCYTMGWYLSNDMQFFVLAPISLLIIKRSVNLRINCISQLTKRSSVSPYCNEISTLVVGMCKTRFSKCW